MPTDRRPLVLVGGRMGELPIGDSVAGAGSGNVPLAIATGETFTAHGQAMFHRKIVIDGTLEVADDGAIYQV